MIEKVIDASTSCNAEEVHRIRSLYGLASGCACRLRRSSVFVHFHERVGDFSFCMCCGCLNGLLANFNQYKYEITLCHI